jgi:hypothetical protein
MAKDIKKQGKLRILAAGDIHGDTSAVKKLVQKAEKENVDLVVLCGDLTFWDESTKYIIGPFLKVNKQVLFVPGNHESFATANFLEDLYKPNAKNIHGSFIKKGEVGIFGCGGSNMGIEQLDEDEIYSILKKSFVKIKDSKKKIMVTHNHPSDTRMEQLSNFVIGSEGVKKAIVKFKPDIALCSHVHEAEGIEEMIGKTRLINVGPKGKIIEI